MAYAWSLDGERHVLSAHLQFDKPINSDTRNAVKNGAQGCA